MKFFLILLNAVIVSFSSVAQDAYSLFPNDSLKYASENYEFPIVLDSIEMVDGETYYHLAPTFNFELDNPEDESYNSLEFDYVSQGAIFWKVANWFGDSVRVDSFGNYILENRVGQLFEIKSKSTLGESWTLVGFENGDYIEASVDSIGVGNLIESTDTTKYIGLTKKDSTNSIVLDDINDKLIVIGKNSGLVSSPGFFEYPYQLEDYSYVGRIHEVLPIEETNRYKVWNMNIGDEFHVVEDHEYYFTSHYLKIVITDKTWDAQNHTFTYSKHISEKAYGPIYDMDSNFVDYGYSVREYDVVQGVALNNYKFLDSTLLGINPDEGFYEYYDSNYSKHFAKAKFNNDFFQVGKQTHYYESDSFIWDIGFPIDVYEPEYLQRYVEGCGGVYQKYSLPILGEDYDIYELQYYKKGNLTWGSPFNIGLEELSENSITVFPNPTSGDIQLDLANNYDTISIRIINLNGQVIDQKDFFNQQTIELKLNGAPGFYFVEAVLNNQTVITKRIIKYE